MEDNKYISMENLKILNKPLTEENIKNKAFEERIKDIIKHKKYASLGYVEPKKMDADKITEDTISTATSSNNGFCSSTIRSLERDNCPFLSDDIINNLIRNDDEEPPRIYNKKKMDCSLLFKVYNKYSPSNLIYCYNYPNKDFKYSFCMYTKFYFVCDKPILLLFGEPFTEEQENTIFKRIGYTITF
jgi:hypothetical protein